MDLAELFSRLDEADEVTDPNQRFGGSVDPDWEPTDPNDKAHLAALKKTGFWGAQGAGLIYYAVSSKRFLLAHRSRQVEQPGTWGTWGGAIDQHDDPLGAARREANEETGYHGPMLPVPLYVFRKKDYRYSNFLGVIDDEFRPRLNWENQGYRWCEYGNWPSPLHFGFEAILADPASVDSMQKALRMTPTRGGLGGVYPPPRLVD